MRLKHRIEANPRIAIFYSTATISGVFSGLIAYGVQKDLTIPGARPAWEWLFLIEGVIAVALGLGIVVMLPRFPDKFDKSWLFTTEEVTVANDRSKGTINMPSIHSILPLTMLRIRIQHSRCNPSALASKSQSSRP